MPNFFSNGFYVAFIQICNNGKWRSHVISDGHWWIYQWLSMLESWYFSNSVSSIGFYANVCAIFYVLLMCINCNRGILTYCMPLINTWVWFETGNISPKLITYASFQRSFSVELYLDCGLNGTVHRMTLTIFRCSPHHLGEGRGFRNINREHRLCTKCNLNEIENEYHFYSCMSVLNSVWLNYGHQCVEV